jgi:hypothetical protein
MTRKLSVMTVVGVAALSFGAPAAFGGVHAGGEAAAVLAQPNPVISYGDAHERSIGPNQSVGSDLNTYTLFDQARPATLSVSPEVAAQVDEAREVLTSNTNGYLDSHERALGTETTSPVNSIYTPFDQARPATLSWSPEVARQVAVARQGLETERYLDAHQRFAPGVGSTEVSTINSGRDIEWPQIGFGLGIGLLLALGLGLIMRTVNSRPFAH